MKLTVATWNMDHWRRTPLQRRAAWEHLHGSAYDVALLQECVPPASMPRGEVVWREIGGARRFGSAVVSLRGWPIEELSTAKSCHSYLSLPLLGTFPGSVAVARVHPPRCAPVTLVSVYAVIDVYATTTLLRQVADLMPLFDSAAGHRVLLGGDINITTQTSGDDLARAKAAFAVIESLGLIDLFQRVGERPEGLGASCPCKVEGCYHVETHRNTSSGTGVHLDYLFASEALAARTRRLRLDNDDATWELSDHCPVVAELELEPAMVPSAWGERYASDVADTVQAVLREPREWGVWQPGSSRRVVRTDRRLEKWIAAFWEGTLRDGRAAQLEIGIWRNLEETGHALVAYAGLLSKPIADKLSGIHLSVPTDSAVRAVTAEAADYLILPIAEGTLPEEETRLLLDAFVASVRIG